MGCMISARLNFRNANLFRYFTGVFSSLAEL
jgi:hypothetical protein